IQPRYANTSTSSACLLAAIHSSPLGASMLLVMPTSCARPSRISTKPDPLSPLHRLPAGGLMQMKPDGAVQVDSCSVRTIDTEPAGALLWLLVTMVPVRPGF